MRKILLSPCVFSSTSAAGTRSNGPVGGIHWHMNIANKVEYIATDDQLLSIPWVRMTNAQGVVTEYRTAEFKDDPAKHRIRRMDCMDCHTRPAHNVHSPNDAVDLALATGRLDPNVPWIKSKAVAALVKPYPPGTPPTQGIATSLRETYPDSAQAEPHHQGDAGHLSRQFLSRDENRLADPS